MAGAKKKKKRLIVLGTKYCHGGKTLSVTAAHYRNSGIWRRISDNSLQGDKQVFIHEIKSSLPN